nr:MAG: replication associated protein [Arizlama virus]
MQRARAWCFTLNNYTKDQVVLARNVDCQYIVFGKEKGANGTPHLQGFVYFKNARTMSAVKKLLPGNPHLEAAKDIPAAIEYCKKDGDVVERGTAPVAPKVRGQRGGDGEKKRWEDIYKHCVNNEFEKIDAKTRIVQCRNLDYVYTRASLRLTNDSSTDCQMQWYWGPSGTGKSRAAREQYPNAYLKMTNKWWDGYDGEQVVLIEDFDVKHEMLCHFLKIWGDRYSFNCERKSGALKIRPKLIIVTSNWHPEGIWSQSGDLEPILRRYKTTHFPVFPEPWECPAAPYALENGGGKVVIKEVEQDVVQDDSSSLDALATIAQRESKRQHVDDSSSSDSEDSESGDEEPEDGISLGSSDTSEEEEEE